MSELKLLCLCDTPTVKTGFASVSRSLTKRWLPHFKSIDIFGINYFGWPHDLPCKIYPAGVDWTSAQNLTTFLNLIANGDYTHVWILCDTHNLSGGKFGEYLKKICSDRKIRTAFYYPVDAPLEPGWMDLVKSVDVPITFTDYGKRETLKVCDVEPHVIPHGVDTGIFYPREDRDTIRQSLFNGWVAEDDYLIVNVNRNERRKAPQHSLEILKHLLDHGLRVKLLLHMPNVSHDEGTNLELIGKQMRMPCGEHWSHNDTNFKNANAKVTEDGLNQLYNAADLVLSTSLGEGWGLAQTESAAAGCRVASPQHTSCAEIAARFGELGQTDQFHTLDLSTQCVTNMLDASRVRYPVDTFSAASQIALLCRDRRRFPLNDAVKRWLDWDRIADEMLKLMLN